MISRSLRFAFSYTERAFTPAAYTSLLQATLPSLSPPEIMHQLYLYEQGVSDFDYDLFQDSALRLLDYQRNLPLSDILTVLRLGQTHNIRNQLVWAHLQAEIHRRLHKNLTPIFAQDELRDKEALANIYSQLEAQSKDYFSLLEKSEVEQEGEDEAQLKAQHTLQMTSHQGNQSQAQSSIKKTLRVSADIKNSIQDIAELLIWYGCRDLNLLKLMLQTQLHPQVLQPTPPAVIRFAQLMTYTCQVHLNQYQENREMYTSRSLKKIYKFQGAHMPFLLENLARTLPSFSDQQLSYIASVIASFPIKKRLHRKQIVNQLSSEILRRGLSLEQNEKAVQEILGNDQKLLAKWQGLKNDHVSLLS